METESRGASQQDCEMKKKKKKKQTKKLGMVQVGDVEIILPL